MCQGKVEDIESRGVAGSDKFGVTWAERKVSDRISVGIYALDVVEVWLTILDDSIMIS